MRAERAYFLVRCAKDRSGGCRLVPLSRREASLPKPSPLQGPRQDSFHGARRPDYLPSPRRRSARLRIDLRQIVIGYQGKEPDDESRTKSL
jgi:hypothetical protein